MAGRLTSRRSGDFVRGAPRTRESIKRMVVARLRHRLWQAEFIGWRALAESFRRDLRAMGVEA